MRALLPGLVILTAKPAREFGPGPIEAIEVDVLKNWNE
jgi:hypothetical protein